MHRTCVVVIEGCPAPIQPAVLQRVGKYSLIGLKSETGGNSGRRTHSPYKPIENYGVIGDLHTVALVGMDGSIDFMCFPEFDSPTIFAALLDHKKGGSFKLAPVMNHTHFKQLYLPESNILLSRFLSEAGVAEI